MIYNPEVPFSTDEFIHTSTGNIISRTATICKPQIVEIPNGRCIISPGVIVRGDLAPVQLNRYTFIGERTVLHPCYTSAANGFKFVPLTIGSHCNIGEDCIISAAVIGMGCTIENNCILSKRCILKDYVKVLEGTVVPPDMVIPPFSIVSGNPAQIIGERAESASTLETTAAAQRYNAYRPINVYDTVKPLSGAGSMS